MLVGEDVLIDRMVSMWVCGRSVIVCYPIPQSLEPVDGASGDSVCSVFRMESVVFRIGWIRIGCVCVMYSYA